MPKRRERYVNVCTYTKPCPDKHYRNNGYNSPWRKALYICLFSDDCNQKERMTTREALKKHGVKKWLNAISC
ncbi:hypothetical protein ES703_120045 [subsurface metagenome]